MKSMGLVAATTFLELVRDRIFYGVMIFALGLLGVSQSLGQLSFAEESRISVNFSFAALHLLLQCLVIYLGTAALARDIDKQTLLLFLVRPISRTGFLIGKYLGILAFVFVFLFGLAIVFTGLCWGAGFNLNAALPSALLGVGLEAAVLLAATFFFACSLRPFLCGLLGFTLFLVGHWIASLDYFAQKSTSAAFYGVARTLQYSVPDLERWNWRDSFVYNQTISGNTIGLAFLYAVAWVGLYLSLAAWTFRRKDLV